MEKQRSDEWHEKRVGKVTGSNVGAILGLHPDKSPEDVLREMVRSYHGYEREFKGNIAVDHGRFHEEGVAAEYEMETGNKIEETGFHVHPEHEWLGASPDGFVVFGGNVKDLTDGAVVEIKCPYGQRDKNPPQFKTAEDQPHYLSQMQIEMACTGRSECHFYQWAPHGTRLEIVYRDDVWLAWAIPKLKAFHELYLSELDNPDHLEPKRVEINTLEADRLIQEHEELSDAIERAAERKKEVLARLVAIAKERDALVCGHKLTKVEKKGSISYAKALKELAPNADLKKWTGKPTSYWRLS